MCFPGRDIFQSANYLSDWTALYVQERCRKSCALP